MNTPTKTILADYEQALRIRRERREEAHQAYKARKAWMARTDADRAYDAAIVASQYRKAARHQMTREQFYND